MVRGDPKCKYFCKVCKVDCTCELSCRQCHTCRDNALRNGSSEWRQNLNTQCTNFRHDCNSMPKDWKRVPVSLFHQFPTLFSSETVEILVGSGLEHRRLRYVPKHVLAENSEYFKRRFSFEQRAGSGSVTTIATQGPSSSRSSVLDNNGGIPRYAKEPLKLEEDVDRPEAFDMFIQFACWKDYEPRPLPDGPGIQMDIRPHAHVYLLADRLQASALADLALRKASAISAKISRIVKSKTHSVDRNQYLASLPDVIQDVYEHTPPPSKSSTPLGQFFGASTRKNDRLRSLITALAASCLAQLKTIEGFEECITNIPDFAVDLMGNVSEGKVLLLDESGYLTR